MNVCGIDSSLTCTGLARIVDGTISTLRIVTEATPPAAPLAARRARVRQQLHGVLNFAPAGGLFVIEAPSLNSRSQGLRVERLGLYWLLIDQLLKRGPVVEVSPKTRALYASGNGNADKKAVLPAVRERFPTVRVPDHNVADAVALMAMGSRALGRPLEAVDLSDKELKAHARLVWPTEGEL